MISTILRWIRKRTKTDVEPKHKYLVTPRLNEQGLLDYRKRPRAATK